MLIAPITVTTAVGASRSICHEILLIYEWTLWPQSKQRSRAAEAAQRARGSKCANNKDSKWQQEERKRGRERAR